MAKLWEVLKAFDEGIATIAKRPHEGQLVELEYNGPIMGVTVSYDGVQTILQNSDFGADRWEIAERIDHTSFPHLYVLFRIEDSDGDHFSDSYSYSDMSLFKAIKNVEYEYKDDTVGVLSAIGMDENGALRIIVKEGEMMK